MELARRVDLINADSAELADAAARDLTAPIPSCPDWVMADLVRHVLQVHRSWCRIVAGFVQRFQVQEAALHRWDAESAVGAPGPIAADGAADAIELDNALLPAAAPTARSAFEVITTDTPFSITISAKPDLPVVGSLRGPASDLLLVLWKRMPITAVATTGGVDAIAQAIASIDID